MSNFSLQKYFRNQYLEESDLEETSNIVSEEKIDIKAVENIYNYLKKVLDPLAKDSKLRMSHFESKYPTVSSFYLDLKDNNII